MFKSEKIMLFLLIGICLIISVVVIDTVMDPVFLVRTVYARITNSPDPIQEGIYIPEFEEEIVEEIISEAAPLLQNGWDWYRSEGYAFEIQFPKEVVRKSNLNQNALNSGVGVNPEAPVWKFRLDDQELYQDTNLVDASILIHVLEGKDQEAACFAFKPGSIYQTPKHQRDSLQEVEINGLPFLKDEVIEGVMGEFYHRFSYRTFAKGACYELTQLLHYQNIAGLSDESISEFDQEEVVAELDKVLQSFILLDVDPTFPELSYPVPKTLSTAVAKATSGDVDGLDVSHWQGDIGWNKVANAGYVFTFAKGTEGVGWTDSEFHVNMNGGNNAGVYMGVYHFARPDLGNSGAEEANYFLSVVGDYLNSGYLRPVLDLEVGYSLGKTALSNWVVEWMETVENRTGISPLIYTNPNFINYYLNESVTEYDLWVAHWTCEPEPSYNVPNTGTWRDWAFWQYYGPGGCGGNAGYVPGISTNIDLNIFNGVEAGLQEYDALSHLWVSLSSDAYYVPAPYFADITGNVNGDTTGLIDYAFWWDCTELSADLATVESVCGVLPSPAEGECEYNEAGLRCLAIENEKQIAEHTYQEAGEFTAKVIVERGTEPAVEDRYKIATYNPIRKITFSPATPGLGSVEEAYDLDVAVKLDTSVSGVLQVSVVDQTTDELIGQECLSVPGDDVFIKHAAFSLIESEVLEKTYQISTRYRYWGACPVEDVKEDDISNTYQISWMDDRPIFELKDSNGDEVPAGSLIDLGDVESFQVHELDYLIINSSTITPLEISSVNFGNLENVVNLQIVPQAPLEVGLEAEQSITLSFEVPSSGPFSFDVLLEHNGSNPTPFRFSGEGNGLLSSNPIQLVDPQPVSPGSAMVGEEYSLTVNVDLDSPAVGTLQVDILDQDDNSLQPPICLEVLTSGLDSYSFDYSLTESDSALKSYQIWARYRDLGTCPIEDQSVHDVSQGYQIDWQEDNPVMELKNLDDEPLLSGGSEDLGDVAPYQSLTQQYSIYNPSATYSFQITGVIFENLVNVINPEIDTSTPIQIGPGEELMVGIGFEIENPGEFSFEIDLEHNASNPTPYNFSILGRGVLEINPVQSITPEPLSPGEKLIGEVFGLSVETVYDAPINGSLVVSLLDQDNNPVQEMVCLEITESGPGAATASFAWSESGVFLNDYTIRAQFYSRSGCPSTGDPISVLSMSYQVDWLEELPVLELAKQDGTLIPADELINLGEFEYYQTVDLEYLIRNISSTTSLEITDIRIDNLVNLGKVDSNPETGFVLDPDAENPLDISFLVDNTGSFSFDLVIDHLASNPTPYRINFQGSGVMTNNPIKFIVPTPPSPGTSLIGSAFPLRIEVGIEAPDIGSLQVSLVDKNTYQVKDQDCLLVEDDLDQARTFNLSWTSADPGNREYSIQVRYRARGECPIVDSQDSDLTQIYVVNWEEDIPELEVRNQSGSLVSSGDSINLGQRVFYQEYELAYTLFNTSTTSDMQVNSIGIENLENQNIVRVDPYGPISLGPEEGQLVKVAFQVKEIGSFSFDLVIDHDANNINPYRFSIQGIGELIENPIYEMTLIPVSSGVMMTSEVFELQIQSEINPPAPGVMEIIVLEDDTSDVVGSTCISVLGEHSLLNVDLSWTESMPGDVMYRIQLGYYAGDHCPTADQPDAVLVENYQVSWQVLKPVLVVNRPEGVTIFDGDVDFIGEHDFFRFVEVTYVIENNSASAPLVIDSIQAENLENIREVLIDPVGPIEILPGEYQKIVINFQILMLKPFSFDLVWDHNGSNADPYTTSIEGTSNLDLGDGVPDESWLFRFVEYLIKSGLFLKIPDVWTGN